MITLGVALNTEIAAPSQYAGFNFNSACVFNGVVLFASDSGIFTNTGDKDATVNIDASFQLPSTNLEIKNPKRMRRVYLTGAFEKSLHVTQIMGDVAGTTYLIDCPGTLKETQIKSNMNYYETNNLIGLEVSNVDGSDFSVDIIEAIVTLTALMPASYSGLGRAKPSLAALTGDASVV